jgi:hypothetical protein
MTSYVNIALLKIQNFSTILFDCLQFSGYVLRQGGHVFEGDVFLQQL